jgi:hypothetical protein
MAEWKKIIVSGSDAHLASVTASNLTNDNIVVVGTGGALESSGLTYDGSTLALGSKNITSTSGTSNLSGSFSGSFSGDGSALTGVTAAVDIDALSALGGTGLHQTQDHFIFSDNGTEKKITFSNLEDAIFANISGDATVAAGGALTIAADSVEGTMLHTSSADGTTMELSSDTLSVLKVPNSLTVDNDTIQLNSGTTFDGSGAKTISVKDGGIDTDALADNSVTTAKIAHSLGEAGTHQFTGSFSGSFTGDGTGLTGLATTLTVDGDSGTQDVSLTADDLQIIGTSNEIETAVTKVSNDVKVTIGLPNDVTIGNNLTVTGDLVVNGDQTILSVTNLAVDDKFIMLNSGSTTAGDESGIVFGGSNGSANEGAALIWNGDYNSNDGRLAVANSVNGSATSASPNYFLAGVFTGSAAGAATVQADHPGNIRVDGSDIYIYV